MPSALVLKLFQNGCFVFVFPVCFPDWKDDRPSVNLLFTVYFISYVVLSSLIPYSNHKEAHRGLLTPPLTWDKLWEVLHAVFSLDLSHGFAWELNQEPFRAEDTWWRTSIV